MDSEKEFLLFTKAIAFSMPKNLVGINKDFFKMILETTVK